MRAAIRLLVALTLAAWGQFAVSAEFGWSYQGVTYPSPDAACQVYVSTVVAPNKTYKVSVSDAVAQCGVYSSGALWMSTQIYRTGDSCSSGGTYDPSSGTCIVPQDCSGTAGDEVVKAQTCQYNASLKTNLCDDQIAYQGCLYTIGKTHGCTSIIEQQTYQCTSSYYGTGQSAGSAPDSCSGEECTRPSPDKPETNCVTANGVQTCLNPEKPGCGSVNGVEGCFQEKPGCGYFNGTYQCIDNDKPNRNCGYYNGKQTCFDPKDPTKVIPDTSSDHPANGGNADGDDTNDPRPSKGEGSSAQGSDEGATNEAVEDLGEKLGEKIDKTNSLLDDLNGKVDELLDGLFGDEFDKEGEGSGAGDGAGEAGTEAGNGLADQIGKATDGILEERTSEVDRVLKDLPGKVENSWFGSAGEKVGLNKVLDKVLPSAVGCATYTIALSLDRYSATLVIPVCQLSRIKPLLEWVIWMITIVGLWKILYSALRQEDAKAAKGGF